LKRCPGFFHELTPRVHLDVYIPVSVERSPSLN
jgi:hypothetical protein